MRTSRNSFYLRIYGCKPLFSLSSGHSLDVFGGVNGFFTAVYIQKELERISITVETLQLWVEQMLADKKINIEKYNEIIGE